MLVRFSVLFFTTLLLLDLSLLQAQTKGTPVSSNKTTSSILIAQRNELPPDSILKNLNSNLQKIEPGMTENEVFKTLGLARYKNHLKANSFIQIDGAGGNWRILLDDHLGYSIAFRDFLGVGNAKCMIRIPEREFWIDTKTSIPALTPKEMQENMNRQVEKLKNRQAKQRASQNTK